MSDKKEKIEENKPHRFSVAPMMDGTEFSTKVFIINRLELYIRRMLY